jgi:2-octaprenyl-6-methoxyphenol hydroxylase
MSSQVPASISQPKCHGGKYDYDTAIVGGGLVGQLLALILAEQGYQVALIEQQKIQKTYTDSFDNRSIALSYPAVCMFHKLGVWDQLSPYATPIERIHVSDKGHFHQVNLNREDEHTPFLGAVVEMPHLLTVLSASLRLEKNIAVIAPAKITGLINYEQGIKSLKLEINQVKSTLSAKLIVACDGAQSQIRDWLGIFTKNIDYKQSALTFNVELKRGHNNIAYERFIGDGVMAMLPITQSRSACVWTMSPLEIETCLKMDDSTFLKLAQSTFGYRLGCFTKVGCRGRFPLHLVYADKLYQGNVLLFGNAAHFLHPVSGQGFNLSFRDVGALYDLLFEFGIHEDNKALFESFEKLRIKDHKRTISVTNGLIKSFLSQNRVIKCGRGLGMGILERGELGKKFANQLMMGRLDPMSSLTKEKVME